MTNETKNLSISHAGNSNNSNKKALRNVKVKIIGTRKAVDQAQGTKTLPEDPFKALVTDGHIIEPPFDLLSLSMLPESSSELNQCVESMQVNIEGFGHRQNCRIKLDDNEEKIPESIKKEVKKEKTFLINFFEYATEESYVGFRKKLRKDIETTGNGYYEVIRSMTGKIQSFKHIPSYQMRLGKQDEELIEWDRPILELQEDNSIKIRKIKEYKRFRKFMQSTIISRKNSVVIGNNYRWFKEFGDPRELNNETGEYEPTPKNKRANEVVHIKIYSSRSPYGIPRIIGNLLSIYGDRASEEINYITFTNNNIPSMVFLCSNGQLTEDSVKRLESFVESSIQGSDNYSKFLIIEGESFEDENTEDTGNMKIDVTSLTKDQHDDALFQNYSKNNQDKIRRSFRIPPILVGKSDDYTRTIVESARRIADEQVFAPERDEFDSFINRYIYPDMGVKYHKFKTNSPNTTDNEQLVKILAGAEKTGGMTPEIARLVLSDILSQDIVDDFPKDFPSNVPFSLTMAEAVKNQADPSEPGQQVTALKAIQGDVIPDLLSDDPVIEYLKSVREAAEEELKE
jgi:PBSX family phage portal protein